ncbi:UbiA family prenyltransferase (plasmid) [Coraliomargarita sp. W4R53]
MNARVSPTGPAGPSPIAALWRSSHPGPSVVVTLVALTLGIAVGLAPWRIIVLSVAIFCGQLSVGISNDAIDVERDRIAGRDDKPLARGDVSLRAAWITTFASLALAIALSFILSWEMGIAHVIFLVSAWSYNAWLKSSVISVVPFIVSFGLLPSLVTLSAENPVVAPIWAGVAGGALGIAIHLTNVLPDLEDDAMTGVRGLPHRLGRRASAVLAALALVVGAVAVLVGPGGELTAASLIVFSAVGLIAVAGLMFALVRPPGRWVFRLVMLAALLLCVQLALTAHAFAP